ncbi:phosphoenolpyruvate-protein phosphotransferase of PTS system [Desulfocucumis palustris]|uniref:Phosphoenolpyruvate-protein phosphotransferase of PTS system n=1 Tax=Desulfocucumis palustris TaxID=1898651 RepID=A0A2L2XC90_9FIRM|nr:putative PEP-binding protein [Desulfocucumis palustris]GBF33845.1 phosphoenolpyruvate-protein phosphotransferase of PTS system [Desulfocucumis palustris]
MTENAATITADGKIIRITAKVQTGEQLAGAAESGAEAIGLLDLRGFSGQEQPDGEEQYRIYREISKIMGDRPVTAVITNWRGHRQTDPDLLKSQLRALLRASNHGNFSLVLPGVSQVSEIIKVKELLGEAQAELEEGNTPFRRPGEIGVMADIPAVLAAMEIFCFESRFFISGDNTINCLFAAGSESRSGDDLLYYFDPAHLSYLQELAERACRRQKRAGISSPMVSEPAAIPLLLGMGYEEIIAPPEIIPATRGLIRRINAHSAKLIASKAISYWEPEKSLRYCRDCLAKMVRL